MKWMLKRWTGWIVLSALNFGFAVGLIASTAMKSHGVSASERYVAVTLYILDPRTDQLHDYSASLASVQASHYPSIKEDGKSIYFMDEQTMYRYLGIDSDPEKALEYSAPLHAQIEDALSTSQIQNGHDFSVHSRMRQLCKKDAEIPQADVFMESPVNYWIERNNGQIQIDLPIVYSYVGAPQNRQEVMQRLPGTVACVEQFYALNGLKLNLRLIEGTQSSAQSSGYTFISLWDTYERDNATNWAALSSFDKPIPEDEACAIWAHETGHLLGLPDRYADPACPDRAEAEHTHDIMSEVPAAKPYSQNLEDADYSLILNPLYENVQQASPVAQAVPSIAQSDLQVQQQAQPSSNSASSDSNAGSSSSSSSSSGGGFFHSLAQALSNLLSAITGNRGAP